jgi:hypothetical protein
VPGDDASPPPMAATPETLAVTALVILYFFLSAAELFLNVRRVRRSQQRRRQQQQVLQPLPTDPVALLETSIAPDPEGEDEPAGGDGREKRPQQQRRRRRARKKRQQQEGAEGESRSEDAAAPSSKAAAAGKGEPLLPRRPQFPLSSVAGALQRRINERYDDLARASEAQCLTVEQVRSCVPSHSLCPNVQCLATAAATTSTKCQCVFLRVKRSLAV